MSIVGSVQLQYVLLFAALVFCGFTSCPASSGWYGGGYPAFRGCSAPSCSACVQYLQEPKSCTIVCDNAQRRGLLEASAAERSTALRSGDSVLAPAKKSPVQERHFVEGSWTIFSKVDPVVERLFSRLMTGVSAELSDLFDCHIIKTGKIFSAQYRIVQFMFWLYCDTLKRDSVGESVFDAIYADSRMQFLTGLINAIALRGEQPLEARLTLSADCVEAYADYYANKRSLSDSSKEALVRIIRMNFLSRGVIAFGEC